MRVLPMVNVQTACWLPKPPPPPKPPPEGTVNCQVTVRDVPGEVGAEVMTGPVAAWAAPAQPSSAPAPTAMPARSWVFRWRRPMCTFALSPWRTPRRRETLLPSFGRGRVLLEVSPRPYDPERDAQSPPRALPPGRRGVRRGDGRRRPAHPSGGRDVRRPLQHRRPLGAAHPRPRPPAPAQGRPPPRQRQHRGGGDGMNLERLTQLAHLKHLQTSPRALAVVTGALVLTTGALLLARATEDGSRRTPGVGVQAATTSSTGTSTTIELPHLDAAAPTSTTTTTPAAS